MYSENALIIKVPITAGVLQFLISHHSRKHLTTDELLQHSHAFVFVPQFVQCLCNFAKAIPFYGIALLCKTKPF